MVFTWPYDIENLKNIAYKIIFEEESCAMMNSDNALAGKATVSREELAKEDNLMIEYKEKTNNYKYFAISIMNIILLLNLLSLYLMVVY